VTFRGRFALIGASFMVPALMRFSITIAILALAVFCGLAASPVRGADQAAADDAFGGALEAQTFALVNQYRHANHLPTLVWDGAIAKTARAHSRDMATGDVDFGHDGFSGRISHLRLVLQGLKGAGENVLVTDNPDQVARKAVDLWLRSPHHLENIRGDYNYSGLGIWQNAKGEIYFTQIFVRLVQPSEEAQQAPQPEVDTPFGMLASPETRPSR